MKKLLTLATLIALSGCSTMHFDNVSSAQNAKTKNETWHHHAALNIVEVTAPVDLQKRCQNGEQWTSVKTEQSFVNGLATGVVQGVTVVPLWGAKTVEVSCN